MDVARAIAVCLTIVLAAPAISPPPRRTISIIVSSRNPVHNLSRADLRRIFVGQTTRWPNDHPIVIFLWPPASPDGRLFLDRIVHLTDIDYSQIWIGAVFRGQVSTVPRIISDRKTMLQRVAADADAIGFLPSSGWHDDSVAVVTIDGKRPSDPGYPLTH